MKKNTLNWPYIILVIVLFAMAVPAVGLAAANEDVVTRYETETKITLTKEEEAYIKENPKVSIAIDTSWAPYGFQQKNGECGGIIPNLMEMVAERVGLSVDFVQEASYADAIMTGNTGKTDLVSGIADDQKMSEKNLLLRTDPYIQINYSAVSKRVISDLYEQGAEYRVAICVGTYAKMAMQKKMPDYKFVEYHSNRECMDAVLNDDADVALIANYSVEYFSGFHEYSSLQTIQINDFSWGLCFGVYEDSDPMLIEILNKGIASLSENDVNQAIYTGAAEAASAGRRVTDVFYERPELVAAIAGIIAIMISVLGFGALAIRRKARSEADLKIQQQLRKNASIVQAAMQSAKMTVWIYDTKTHEITQKASSMEENDADSIIQDAPESLIRSGYVHPDHVEAYRRLFDAARTASDSVQDDFMVKTEEKRGYWWKRLILTPVIEADGEVKIIGTSIDVTYRKKREEQYMRLVESMSAMDNSDLIAKGRYNLTKNRMLYYYRKASGSLDLKQGITFDEALSGMVETAINPKDGEELERRLNRRLLLEQYMEEKTEGTYEYERSLDKGAVIWSLLKYNLFEEPESGDIIFFVYTYDITKRVIDQNILKKLSSAEYEVLSIMDIRTEHYSVKATKSHIEQPDFAMEGNYEDVVADRIPRVVIPEEQELVRSQFALDHIITELKDREKYMISYSILDDEGQVRRKMYQFCYLDDSKLTLLYYRSDITEMYKREQQQLFKTEEALRTAERASEAKTEFFSRMSHDMRTPMNGILGMVDLSEEEEDAAVLKQNMEKIKISGEYLLGLINDTLDFQKIEGGKLKLENQVVYSRELIEDITGMIRSTAKEKDIDFKINLRGTNGECYFMADPLRMKQVFVNLLSNAVKFTPEGGTVELCIEILQRENTRSNSRITITDTGVGMSKEFLEHGIFRPFSQEQNEMSMRYAGTGLGLSITKKLVDLMGGSIKVKSEPGVGTEFTIELSFERVDISEYQKVARADQKRSLLAANSLQGKKILLAEDHPLNAEIAVKLLEKKGCSVTWAKDGRECVERFTKEDAQYDVVLMDMRMPVMDGLEASRAIRRSDKADAHIIPIIALTANAYADDVARCREAGMNEHIPKPIEPLILYETIAKVLNESKIISNG